MEWNGLERNKMEQTGLVENRMEWLGMGSNKMDCLGTKREMEQFGPGWNGLKQNGWHGEGESCG